MHLKFISTCNNALLKHVGSDRDVAIWASGNIQITLPIVVFRKKLVDYAVGMYELYHVEAIENAFADLDRRLSA